MMELGVLLRRLIHLLTPIYLIFYFLPDPLWPGGPSPEVGVLLVLIGALVLEILRLTFQWQILGMRDYESNRISAAAQAGVALTITFLFFPLELAAPVLFGMALVDPLTSYVRRSRWYPLLPIIVYFSIAFVLMACLIEPSVEVLVASIIASVVAIAAEYPRSSYIDDDFLMIMAPLLALAVFFGVTSSFF